MGANCEVKCAVESKGVFLLSAASQFNGLAEAGIRSGRYYIIGSQLLTYSQFYTLVRLQCLLNLKI